jgi:hypothetical protein
MVSADRLAARVMNVVGCWFFADIEGHLREKSLRGNKSLADLPDQNSAGWAQARGSVIAGDRRRCVTTRRSEQRTTWVGA